MYLIIEEAELVELVKKLVKAKLGWEAEQVDIAFNEGGSGELEAKVIQRVL